MGFGGEMAHVKPYERRKLSRRCFKRQQYEHQEARCKRPRPHVATAPTSATPWSSAHRRKPIAPHARASTRLRTEGAPYIWSSYARIAQSVATSRRFKILQANMGKRSIVQQSLMNDDGLKVDGVPLISKPSCFRDDSDNVISSPSTHAHCPTGYTSSTPPKIPAAISSSGQ
jgi:hypothetical protein